MTEAELALERAKKLAFLMTERFSMNPISAKLLNEAWRLAFPDEVAVARRMRAMVEALEKAQTRAIEQGRTACELFDEVTALRQRIAELEYRTVTVKLPDDEDGQAYGFGKWANGKLPATAGTMTIAYCEDAWRAAFEVFSSAAGIKVEAE
ncbi:hypothetical protein [Klebsiella variicola]|uniref:hypothetical protein n=1 Tax=Klebsiella variicola TaxID=244366 RepID=UPI0007CA2201|nr:hypothetical protein [Klebsiella variicola]SAS66014.1 RelE family toxin-antitoxin system [Klebsiella variicola]HDS5377344.1 hypothetical protein [Klebsiella pneumoniae subsp. pneumoniae]